MISNEEIVKKYLEEYQQSGERIIEKSVKSKPESSNIPNIPNIPNVPKEVETQFSKSEVEEYDYPYEIIDLPSKGVFYPAGHPLKSGKISIKYMTTKEEDILTSQNLIKKGIVMDEFLKSIILTKFDYGTLLIGDKNAIIVAARILGYGSDYDVEIKCGNCSHVNKKNIDLRQLKYKEPNLEFLTERGTFLVELPITKKKVEIKLLNSADEFAIQEELKRKESQISARLKRAVVSIEGITDRKMIAKFVENMPVSDSKFLRKFLQEHTPDVDMNFDFVCENCGHTEKMPIPLEANFFFPD